MCQSWQCLKNLVFPMSFRTRSPETCRETFFNPMSQSRRPEARHRATYCMSQVSRHRETGRTRIQNGFNLSKKEGFSGYSHNPVVEQPVVEITDNTPDEMWVSSEEESVSRSSCSRGKEQETKCKQANWQTQCYYETFSQRSGL